MKLYEHERLYQAKRDAGPELYEVLAEIINWPCIRFAIGDQCCARADTALAKVRADASDKSGGARQGICPNDTGV